MPRSAATPFVLMASDLDEIGWREAIDLGATDFLLKPLTIAALRTVCFHCCRPAEFKGGNVVPLRNRERRERIEQQIAAALAQETQAPVATAPEAGRGRLRNCYDQILRLLAPAPG
jgi:PleD family two-component response regulator